MCKWNFLETPIQSVQRSLNLLFQRTFFMMFSFLKKYLNPQVRTNNICKQCCLPPLSLKISFRDTSFHISLISLGFYLFPECLLSFLWLVYSTMCGKFFQFIVFTFPESALNLCIFIHAPVPHSKLQVEFFENLFSRRRKGWRKLWFALLKINQKI